MPENMLTKTLVYKGIVNSITPCSRNYHNKHTDNLDNCHDVILLVDGFPGTMFNAQICNTLRGIPDFEINDYIAFRVVSYYPAEDRYTIKFENKAFKAQVKKETIGAPAIEAKKEIGTRPIYEPTVYPDSKRSEPQIMGTKWSICLTAAYNFHKDRKGATDDNVLSTLKAYMRDFNEYQKDEEKYLAND